MQEGLDLLSLFGKDQLNEIQDRLSRITKLGFITVDYRGEPMTDYTGFCDFCHHFRDHPELRKNCQASDAMSSVQASISGKPLIYRCPCGIMEISIPILVNGVYLGGFLGGQALCQDAPEGILQMRPVTDRAQFDETVRQAAEDRESLPVFDYAHFENIAELVNLVITLLCEGKIQQMEQEQTTQTQLQENRFFENSLQLVFDALRGTDYPEMLRKVPDLIRTLHEIHGNDPARRSAFLTRFSGTLSQMIQNTADVHNLYPVRPEDLQTRATEELWLIKVLDYLFRQDKVLRAPVLDRVFDHINQNLSDYMTLSVLVEESGLSQSYLSRLFRNLFSVTVTDYIHLRKIQYVKQLLLQERMLVGDAALQAGYNEYTYFSKIFKKYEGITVQEYRRKAETADV